MDILPYFIHWKIYSYLPAKEKVIYHQLNQYIRLETKRKFWKTVDFDSSSIPPYLNTCGKYIKILKFNTYFSTRSLGEIIRHCPSIEHLQLSGPINIESFQSIVTYLLNIKSFCWKDDDFAIEPEYFDFTLFTKLEILKLDCAFIGFTTILNELLKPLTCLTNLTYLYLNVSNINHELIHTIHKLQSLKWLELYGKFYLGHVQTLNKIKMDNLLHLSLSEILIFNEIEDEEFQLIDSNSFPNLEALNFSPETSYESRVAINQDILKDWKSPLVKLNMRPYFNRQIDNSLFLLKHLKLLALYQANLDNDFLVKLVTELKLLSALSLSDCIFDDKIFKEVPILFRLKHIELKGVKIKKYCLEWLALCLPSLRWLHLSNCSHLFNAKEIESLDIHLDLLNLQFIQFTHFNLNSKSYIKLMQMIIDKAPNKEAVYFDQTIKNEIKLNENVTLFYSFGQSSNYFPKNFFSSLEFKYEIDADEAVLFEAL
ncbi:RNI-like protein [Neoconidiobolus thromboides FSU 785]|nr:RNI-like protein [Neoconidiobolus thromboides FSU 785]